MIDSGGQRSGDGQKQGEKIKLEIYYDTLNYASRRFFVEEFKPVYDYLWNFIDLLLIPYGNTTQYPGSGSDNFTYECQYGPDQCYANRIQVRITPENNLAIEIELIFLLKIIDLICYRLVLYTTIFITQMKIWRKKNNKELQCQYIVCLKTEEH